MKIKNTVGRIYLSTSKALVNAKKFHKKGELNKALQEYIGVLNRFPNNIKARTSILQIYEGLSPSDNYSTSSGKQLEVLTKLMVQKKFADVLKYGEILIRLNSREPKMFNILGAASAELGSNHKAISFFKQAIKLLPSYHEVHNNIAITYKNIGHSLDAVTHFNKAIKLKPNYSSAYYNLGSLYEKLSKYTELHNLIVSADNNLSTDDPTIQLFKAYIESTNHNFEECLKILSKINPEHISSNFQIDFYSLCGKTYDKLQQYPEAFKSFCKQNDIIKSINHKKLENPKIFYEETKELKEAWESTKINTSNSNNYLPHENLVFLSGFPRTGTTLLDTILMGHPEIIVLEEQPMAALMATNFDGLGTPSEYLNISEDNALTLRKTYIDELMVRLGNRDESKVIIDKHPLNTRYIPLLKKAFPNAKFIIALRHPCDCVLSCFMQNFEFNAGMGNFLSLEDSAKLYSVTMGLWVALEQKLNLDFKTVRYEDLIQDVEGVSKSLINFLNLTWDSRVLNHRKTARNRGQISTASYNQVTQNIYKTSRGRWKNYEQELSHIIPDLAPYIKKFGY